MATKKHSRLKTYLENTFIEFSQPESDRLRALYSDFSKLAILNKYAFDTNVSYWRQVILDCSQQGHLGCSEYATVINTDTIAEKFQRPVMGKPLALDTVLESMEKEDELILLHDFTKRFAPPTTWLGWILDTVVKNTWQWRWRPLTDSKVTPLKQYVVLPTIKAVAKAVLAQHFHQHGGSPIDHIMTLSQFKANYAHHFVNELELTEADIMLVLRYLHSQHGVAIADHVKGYGTSYMAIKFPTRQDQVATITQHDEAVISIRTTCYALSVQVDELQKKSEELAKEAAEEKKRGHISKALYCLKRKKNLQEILERRLKSMETMDTVLLKIESSQDDVQVVQAFNMGADALRSLLGEDGLSLESVDETMEKIQAVLQDQKEVEDALQIGTEDMMDTTEVEQELLDLIEQDSETIPQTIPKDTLPKDTLPNSELSRLNQMFAAAASSNEPKKKKQLELAS